MKNIAIIFSLIASCSLFGQQSANVKLQMRSGDTKEVTYKLRLSERDGNVFPSDSKDFLKITQGEEKIKIQKSDILSISVGARQYEVIYDEERDYYVIGYFVTRGKKSLFKTYSYGRMTVYSSGMPQQSINKVVSTTYLLFEKGDFETISWKKDPKTMIEECQAYADYHSVIKRWKNSNIEDAFTYYNENCK